jgi:hypothetical protein
MPKLSDVKSGDVFCTIIKGEHGTGKSILAASYALAGPTYVFDFEDRMRSVANYYRRINRSEIINNIEYDTYFSFHKMRMKIEEIMKRPKLTKNVIFDSLTSFTGRALSNTKDFKRQESAAANKQLGKVIGEFRVNTIEDYNAEAAAIQEFIVEKMLILKSLGINVILTAHVIKVKEEGEGGETHIARYLMTGGKKAAQMVPGYYDEIYHTNIKMGAQASAGNRYTVVTRHTVDDFAKTAMNLPFEIDYTDKVFYDELKKYIPATPAVDISKDIIIPQPKLDVSDLLNPPSESEEDIRFIDVPK